MKKKLKVSKRKKQNSTTSVDPWSPTRDDCICYGGDSETGFSTCGTPCGVHVREAVKTARQREREVCAKIAQKFGYLVLAELLRKDSTNQSLRESNEI